MIDEIVFLIYNFPGRKNRHEFTTEETSLLMSELSQSPYVNRERKKCLSEKLGISIHEVCAWFDRQRISVRNLEAQINWKGD